MIRNREILETIRMVQEENLDVRTVTMGINGTACADADIEKAADSLRAKIRLKAGNLVRVCDQLATQYGIDVVNKRLAVSPVSQLLEKCPHTAGATALARAMDEAATEVGVDLIGDKIFTLMSKRY